jgi:predicted TPR repeat methyltransferase
VCQKHDFAGSVLDIGCGTGLTGKIILKYNKNSEITGIDLAEGMAKRAMQNGYKEVYVGLMEEAVPSFLNQGKKFDHITSLASVCFLPNNVFNDFLTSLFVMANKSVTLEIDEITDKFLANLEKTLKFQSPLYNNVPVIEKFNLPSS